MERGTGNEEAARVAAENEMQKRTPERIVEDFEKEGYVREGEHMHAIVHETPITRTLKEEKHWAGGEWQEIGEIRCGNLTTPSEAQERPPSKTDPVYDRLIEAGYRVAMNYGPAESTDELDVFIYTIYKL